MASLEFTARAARQNYIFTEMINVGWLLNAPAGVSLYANSYSALC